MMDRIQELQQAHPWMLEREARAILVFYYYLTITDGDAEDEYEVQDIMDSMVQDLCLDTRKNVEELIQSLPPKLLEPTTTYG